MSQSIQYMKTIVIIGNGQLATEYRDTIISSTEYNLIDWNFCDTANIYAIVHAGSGRQYIEACEYAKMHEIPFIQCATHELSLHDLDTSNMLYIDAPNTNIVILQFITTLRNLRKELRNPQVTITESHQKDKKTLP